MSVRSSCWNTLGSVCPELATDTLQHGEWGEKRLSTQESSLLTPELEPAPSITNKGCVFHTTSMCAVGMSVVYDSRVAAAQVWGFYTFGMVRSINVLAESL